MEHWGWSKNWVCEGLSNGAQNASTGDGGPLTKGINSFDLEEATAIALTHLTNNSARATAGLPAPARLELLITM